MAIYDSETNTFDGVPAEDYHRKMRIIQHGAPLGSKSEEEEGDKQYFGFGLLVLTSMFVISWIFPSIFKIALYVLIHGWIWLLAIALILIGAYFTFLAPKQ